MQSACQHIEPVRHGVCIENGGTFAMERGQTLEATTMRRILRDQGLTLTMFALFALFLVFQILTGLRTYNHDQRDHGESTVTYGEYLRSGHFVEATFENWESEYLQMGFYVFLTAFLYQRGSSE